jgi:hypothetical protein
VQELKKEGAKMSIPQNDDANRLFLRMNSLFDEYIYFDEPGYKTLSIIYAVFTHLYDIFDVVPYLQIYGPRDNGKSRLGDIFTGLCFKPDCVSQITPAALYREIAAAGSGLTLIIDEADNLSSKKGHSELLRILRSGYRWNGKVVICEGKAGVTELSTFCPKIIINLEGIADQALDSRTIPIVMVKSQTNLKKYRSKRVEGEYREIRNLIQPFLESHRDSITDGYESFQGVEGISNREEEIWTPIFLLADLFDKRPEMGALARKISLQKRDIQLIGDRDTQILEATQTFISKEDPINVDGFYRSDKLCDFIRSQLDISRLRVETVSRVLYRYKIIKEASRPRLEGGQRTCYLFDKERLAELTKEYFQEGEL